MDYAALMDLVSKIGVSLASSGAETYRVEESITRILTAYGQEGRVYCVPNSLFITILIPNQLPYTQLSRMPKRGNNIDAVELYNSLSRRICAEVPDLPTALEWLSETEHRRKNYDFPMMLLGHMLVASGFCFFFGGSYIDCACAALCGLFLGIVSHLLSKVDANNFFQQLTAAFLMSGLAYTLAHWGVTRNVDTVVIGTLMLLVPGLLFTNGIRDIIFGDTNSGINRVVEALLIAAAVALGTAIAWNMTYSTLGIPDFPERLYHSDLSTCIASFVACLGFVIIFNIHGYGNTLCALGSALTWAAYCIGSASGLGYFACCLIGTMVSAAFAEVMARIRKYPAISYLIIAVLPLIPGSSIYYTALAAVQGNMDRFIYYGTETLGTAGAMAVGILLVSTSVRIWASHQANRK